MAETELEVTVRQIDDEQLDQGAVEALADVTSTLSPGEPEPETVDGFWSGIGKGLATFAKSTAAYTVELVPAAFRAWHESNEERGQGQLDILLQRWRAAGTINAQLEQEIREVEEALPWPIDWALIWLIGLKLGLLHFFEELKGLANLSAQQSNVDIRPNLIGLDVLQRAWHRFPSKREELRGIIERWGIPSEQIDLMLGSSMALPSLTELLVLVNREHIEEPEAMALLEAQGLPTRYSEELLKLREFWPSPTDLVSLAGREAFEEEAIRRFQLDYGLEEISSEPFRKAGVSDQVKRWYWIAHWQNPSIQQVFQMIHRKARKPGPNLEPGQGGEFDLDDLRVYGNLADINPFFVDLLRQIAFRIPTRVDTRRMFEMSVIDRDKVKEIYEAQGYDEPTAELLTQFAEQLKDSDTRKLTRSQVEQMFHLGQIDRIQLQGWLQAIGYDAEESTSISYLEQSKKDEKRLRSFIRRAEFDYKRQVVDRLGVQRFLSGEDITAEQIESYFEEWDNEIPVEAAQPSKEDLSGWLGAGKIDEVRFRSGMELLRYSTEDIDLYLEARGSSLSKTDLLRLYDRGQIEEERARSGLAELGYQSEDIHALIVEVTARKRKREGFDHTKI